MEEVVEQYIIECLTHIRQNRAYKTLLIQIHGDSFNEADLLDRCAVFGSETKLLVAEEPAPA